MPGTTAAPARKRLASGRRTVAGSRRGGRGGRGGTTAEAEPAEAAAADPEVLKPPLLSFALDFTHLSLQFPAILTAVRFSGRG